MIDERLLKDPRMPWVMIAVCLPLDMMFCEYMRRHPIELPFLWELINRAEGLTFTLMFWSFAIGCYQLFRRIANPKPPDS